MLSVELQGRARGTTESRASRKPCGLRLRGCGRPQNTLLLAAVHQSRTLESRTFLKREVIKIANQTPPLHAYTHDVGIIFDLDL
jgi:hypothetical protein